MSKYLTTLALIVGGIFPTIMDVGNTHLLNPDWESHAPSSSGLDALNKLPNLSLGDVFAVD